MTESPLPTAVRALSPEERAVLWTAQRELLARRQEATAPLGAPVDRRGVIGGLPGEGENAREPDALAGASRHRQEKVGARRGTGFSFLRRAPFGQGNSSTSKARDELDPGAMTERALFLARERLTALRPGVRPRLQAVYAALVEAAYTLVAARGQSRFLTSYTFFTVLDALPVVTGLSAATCERAVSELRERGLIATWRWYTKGRFLDAQTGETREQRCCGGTFVCVLLRPKPQARAVVRRSELPAAPRDLDGDRRRGHTAWQLRAEAKEDGAARRSVTDTLLPWELRSTAAWTPQGSSTWAVAESGSDVIWALSAVVSAAPQRRGETISAAATALTRLYRDPASFRHYCRILHRAVTAELRGVPALSRLQFALQRVLIGATEGNVRRPGALLVRELQSSGWWDEVYRAA